MSDRWIRAGVDLFNPSHDLHPMAQRERACSAFAWLDLIAMARWRDGGGLKRGQVRVSQRFLAVRWTWSRNRVSRFLECLEEEERIVRERSHQHSHEPATLTICNYDAYHPSPATNDTTKPAANGAANGAKEVRVPIRTSKKTSREPPKKSTWITPYWDLWQEEMGAPPIAGKLAKFLKPIHDRHGAVEVVPRLRRYLRETDPQYISVSRFAETYAKWDPALSDDERPAFPGYPHV